MFQKLYSRQVALRGLKTPYPHSAPTHRTSALPEKRQAENTGAQVAPPQLTHTVEILLWQWQATIIPSAPR